MGSAGAEQKDARWGPFCAPIRGADSRPIDTPAKRTDKRPNFVFILTDDLSWNLVKYMPTVAKMQAGGVTFANYFVTDSLCCPSRSSIFTGRYPHNTGIFTNTGNDGGYVSFARHGHEAATFATALSAAGYSTAMLGKYLNGYKPNQHKPAAGWTLWSVAGAGYREFNYNLNQNGSLIHHGRRPADYLTDVLSATAADFVAKSAATPFLVEIATFTPHSPFVPAPRDENAFPGLTAPRGAAFDAAPSEDAPRWLKAMPALSDADKTMIDRKFRKRAQTLLAIDKMIGELQAAVAAIGQQDNTYFIFSSDNGFHMGEYRLRPGKMTAYDTDIRVPLIVTGPGVPSGRRIDAVAENTDLCPTFIDLAGAKRLPEVDGRSLAPLLRGDTPADLRGAALIEHHGPSRDPADPDAPPRRSGNPPTYAAMRTPAMLYVEYATGEKEYHDLASDPDELRNSYRSLPGEQKTELHTALAKLQACHGAEQCLTAEQRAKVATQK
jgi:N-acetylglucosamine-6-sulfatase